MKSLNVKKSFQNKNVKYGGYATIVTIILIAILIVVNLVVGKLDIKVDLTKNELFSLSDQTYKILDGLDKEINIYALYETGKEEPIFKNIFEKYDNTSDKINVIYKDPVLYPTFTSKYKKVDESIPTGSVIVEETSTGKYKVINSYDMVNFSQGNQYGQQYASSLAVEERVTGAIDFVTSDENPVIYTLKGHNEGELAYDVTNQLEKENFEVEDISLLNQDIEVNEDTTLLVISPKQDITKDESDKIIDYLDNGGRAVLMVDYYTNELPNFEAIMKRFGIQPQKGIVVEGDGNHYFRSPMFLLPEINQHDITESLVSNNIPVMVPNSMGLEILQEKQRRTKIEPLLTTTDNSWIKTGQNPETFEKEDEDINGPVNVALAVKEDKSIDNKIVTTKLIVIGNSQFLSLGNVAGNIDFIMNSFNWLQDKKQSISIRPKSIIPDVLNINSKQVLVCAGVFVIIIPLVILLYGLSVWLRRRHL